MPVITISRVGYKANPDKKAKEDKPFVSQDFSVVLELSEKILERVENGERKILDDKLPDLPEGWFDSPEKVTQKETYAFTEPLYSEDIKVISQ